MTLKEKILEDVKTAMRARDKERLAALRLIQAQVKQVEVDTRQEVDDSALLELLNRMLKQRRESIAQFRAGGREDLSAIEEFEMGVIGNYLPAPLEAAALTEQIRLAIAEVGATRLQDMGQVMACLRPRLLGRADMAQVSQQVRQALTQ